MHKTSNQTSVEQNTNIHLNKNKNKTLLIEFW